MTSMQWVYVPGTGNVGKINCPTWMVEANIVPFQRAKDVIAGRQSWGVNDEKNAMCMCDVGDLECEC